MRTSYKIKQDDKFSPFSGVVIDYPIGTVIWGDRETKTDFGSNVEKGFQADIDSGLNRAKTQNNHEDYGRSGDTPSSYYGYERNQDVEKRKFPIEQGIEKAMTASGIINSGFMQTLVSDPSIMAFYINALTYGSYTTGDIINDMKRREMVSQGNVQARTLKIIDPEMDRSTYQQTPDGQKSVSDTASIIPTFNFQGLLNPEILKYGSNMPEPLFNTLVPIQDPNSQEFKDAVEKVKAGFYDLASAQLLATSEQEKSIADYNYSKFKEQLETNYGISLSDDATKAWKQIEDLENTMNTRGLLGSGMGNEAMDDTLSATRRADKRLRESKLTDEEKQMASVYATSATPDQIKKLIEEDIAKGLPQSEWRATKWGLAPTDAIKKKYSLESLRAQYPEKTDKEIQVMHDAILDVNENYRSAIYSKYYGGLAKNDVINTDNAKATVRADSINKTDTAYTDALGDTTGADPLKPITPITPSSDNDGLKAAGDAAANMGTKAPDDPSNKYRTDVPNTLNTNYKPPVYQTQPIKSPDDPSNMYRTDVPNTLNTNYKAPVVTQTPTPTKPIYSGSSIVDYLKSIGQDSSYENRAKLYGSGYTKSGAQNTALLKKLRGY